MPEEVSRVVKRKRIDGVDVPVIVQITFKDDFDRGWESQYTIDNSAQGDRDVHVATITGDGTDETGQKDGLKVERVDVLRVLDGPDRGQESFFAPDSRTVNQPPDAPPYFITHEKTHIVRYINTPDDGNSLDSELIDEIRFNDPNDRGQDTYIILANPPDNRNIDGITVGDPVEGTNDGNGNPIYTIQVDPSLDDISDSENGIDPPWRLDPFQNIVSGGYYVVFFWSWEDWAYGGIPDIQYFPFTGNRNHPESEIQQVPGQDGQGQANPLSIDMESSSDDPLSDLVNQSTGAGPATIDNVMKIGHPVAGCGYLGFSDSATLVEFPSPCPPGDPHGTVPNSGSTFPGHHHYQSFVFSGPGPTTPPSDDDENPTAYTPTTFRETLAGLPASLPIGKVDGSIVSDDLTYQIEHPEEAPAAHPYTMTFYFNLSQGRASPVVTAMVVAAKDVKLKLDDDYFPLRKKDDTTEYPDTVQGILDRVDKVQKIAKSVAIISTLDNLWRENSLEPTSDEKWIWANNTFEWRFENRKYKFTADPEKRRPILWPVSPAAKTVTIDGNDARVGKYTISVWDKDGPFSFQDQTSAFTLEIGDPPPEE